MLVLLLTVAVLDHPLLTLSAQPMRSVAKGVLSE